jgi:predicted GH43/DUF377 family glycosyl hydrolase
LQAWSDPACIAVPEQAWEGRREGGRIGGSTPPIRTGAGWLVFYHGVELIDPATRRVCYRLGAMMLDLNDPTVVLARTREPLMEPEAYYERFGLYIPNVIFPTGNVVVDGTVYLYYGVCDTAIALATAPLEALVERVMRDRVA